MLSLRGKTNADSVLASDQGGRDPYKMVVRKPSILSSVLIDIKSPLLLISLDVQLTE
jgi:hypothetical protein